MTAQAGAVACDVVWPDGWLVATRVDIDYADELLREYKWRDCVKANFLYTTPPAAVPVADLEGLVAGLNDSIAHNDESEDWLRGAKTTAEFIRDELTTLIKERGNGAP